MTFPRRRFIKSTIAAGITSTLPMVGCSREDATVLEATKTDTPKPLRLLVLGGTGFIGPHEINYAVSRGHTVTMFNRGKTAPGLFPDVESLIGDRDGQLDALKGREWDAVIDNSGFYPRHARLSAELLKGNVGQYMFVSSISAYGEELQVGQDEFEAAYATMEDPTDESESPYGPSYGPRKALCEQEVAKVFGDDAINIRPGIITGVGDPSERLRHWLPRMVAGNEILVPDPKDLPVQYIDAADMCSWMVNMLEAGTGSGPYNAVGAEDPYIAKPLLETLIEAANSTSTLTWVPWEFINENTPEDERPRYAPWYGPEPIPFMQVNNDRAIEAGLTFRPIADTAKDMIANLKADYVPQWGAGGLSMEKEVELLAKWHAEIG